jgi:hypothetical protein
MRRWVIAFVTVAVLLTVASRFVRLRVGPRHAEHRIIQASIRTAEEAYFREFGQYVAAAAVPQESPGGAAVAWPSLRADHGFGRIGYAPERRVRCQYAVAATPTSYTVEALCPDPRGGEPVAWGYVKPEEGETRGVVGRFGRCGPQGVYSKDVPSGEFERVGPCDEASAAAVQR